jgi:hypothetical protein
MKRIAAITLLLAIRCATAPPATPPQWTEVPPSILNALCARLRTEGVSSESQVAIVNQTQPIITANSMLALGRQYAKGGNATGMADALNQALAPLPVSTTGASCAWTPIAHLDPRRDHERMVVQLSAPFVNPFQRSEAGLFARFSVGGQAPQWYWIPLAEAKGQWMIGGIMPLDLHEE